MYLALVSMVVMLLGVLLLTASSVSPWSERERRGGIYPARSPQELVINGDCVDGGEERMPLLSQNAEKQLRHSMVRNVADAEPFTCGMMHVYKLTAIVYTADKCRCVGGSVERI